MALTRSARVAAPSRQDEPRRPGGDTTALLEARSLYRFYRVDDDETLALQGVSLHVWPGELVVVAGPSGSGKSTLLACLAGLDEPSGGTVYINGVRVSQFPNLTVIQNIGLAQSLVGAPPAKPSTTSRHPRPDDESRHRWPGTRPSGAAVRLGVTRAALAVALANDPVVLIADQPTGEHDSSNEARLLGLLVERARAGHAVMVASHSPAVIRRLPARWVVRDGNVQATTSTSGTSTSGTSTSGISVSGTRS